MLSFDFPDLKSRRGRAMVEESGRKVTSLEAEQHLGELLAGVEEEIADTATALAKQQTLEGILYRRSSGQEWVAVNVTYSRWGLGMQALAFGFAILTAVLIVMSVGKLAPGRRIMHDLTAALPPSL
jgi:hypothetical protein